MLMRQMGMASEGNNNSLLWGMSSMLVVHTLTAAWNAFERRHGSVSSMRLVSESTAQIGKALTGKQTDKTIGVLEQAGSMRQPTWISELEPDTKVFLGGAVLAFTAYLHKVGATSMKERTSRLVKDYENPMEAGLQLGNEGMVERFLFDKFNWKRMCYGLYTQNEYYTQSDDHIAYMTLNPMNTHPVRVIANVMIGLLLQIPSSIMRAQDPIEAFLTWAQITGYWEVLARMTGKYGWAPVYLVTHGLVDIMQRGQSSIKKKTRSRR